MAFKPTPFILLKSTGFGFCQFLYGEISGVVRGIPGPHRVGCTPGLSKIHLLPNTDFSHNPQALSDIDEEISASKGDIPGLSRNSLRKRGHDSLRLGKGPEYRSRVLYALNT